MFDKIIMALFYKKEKGGVLTISCKGRDINEETIKKISQPSSGIYKGFAEREKFYKQLFISCSQR